MTAQPRPIRPARKHESYVFEHHGVTVELPAAEVDRAAGAAVCKCGARLLIRWRAELATRQIQGEKAA